MVSKLSIVLVEDHDDLRELTRQVLVQLGHSVQAISSAEELDDLPIGADIDLFLIDLNLPGEDGLSLSKRLRSVHPQVGIVMVTARTRLGDKLEGYESGADIYLHKPVEFDELCAVVNTFVRRKYSALEKHSGLVLSQQVLSGPSGETRLSSSEVDLLSAISRAPSLRLETWQLAEVLKLDVSELNKSSLEVRIVRLRKKLIQVGAAAPGIDAIRNFGYRLSQPVKILP